MKLTIQNLSKTYPNGVQALKNVSLEISNGMFGLLGPNGAGKSTLMRTIATLQEADSGTIMLDDIDVLKEKPKVREILGYLPQEFSLDPKVTADDFLDHIALLKGLTDPKNRKETTDALFHQTNLWEHKKKKLGTFSGGMKQRFGIAQALINSPKLLIVDEPTAGLDPEERNRFHNLLSEIGENHIVILSTHIVDDVSYLCSNMAVINKGQLLLNTKPSEAIKTIKNRIYEKEIMKSDINIYKEKYRFLSSRFFSGKTFIKIYSDSNPGDGFINVVPDLEDVYFHHIKNGLTRALHAEEVNV
ncbi:MAG TPA: ABC transporter ATP-binding protein [Clostridiales bacterium]|jgi:ABC-2 type transport system ATP-binding protein|nr:ABC transporter ATP-binding protein [Clostridiales bacterium]HQP69695.1 ABC transporter ATP-binding protein [Clostridiales bacterium]